MWYLTDLKKLLGEDFCLEGDLTDEKIQIELDFLLRGGLVLPRLHSFNEKRNESLDVSDVYPATDEDQLRVMSYAMALQKLKEETEDRKGRLYISSEITPSNITREVIGDNFFRIGTRFGETEFCLYFYVGGYSEREEVYSARIVEETSQPPEVGRFRSRLSGIGM